MKWSLSSGCTQPSASDLYLLFIVLGGVSLLVGAIGIANVTLVSVMERTGEIGLRRALGAGRRHVTAQFLLESSVIGFVGGVVGASVGVLTVVAVSAQQSWTPVLNPELPFAAPVIGALIGLWRARIRPPGLPAWSRSTPSAPGPDVWAALASVAHVERRIPGFDARLVVVG